MTTFTPKIKMLLKQQCHLCLARFSTSGHLGRHMSAHGANRRYKCTGCDCSFSRNDNLKKHFENAHNSNSRVEDTKISMIKKPMAIIYSNDFVKPIISASSKITDVNSSIKIENSNTSPVSLIEDDNTSFEKNDDDDDKDINMCINTDSGWMPFGLVDPCSIYPPGEAPNGCPEYTLLHENNNENLINIDLHEEERNDYICQVCSFECSNKEDIEKHLNIHINMTEEKFKYLDSDDEVDVKIENISDNSCNEDNDDEYDKDESNESYYINANNPNSSAELTESSILKNFLKISNSSDMQSTAKSPDEIESNKREQLCDACGYKFVFVKKSNNNIEIEIYNSQNNDPCDECKSKYDKINQNYSSNINDEYEKQELLRCSYCEYECEDNEDLQKHVTSHNMLKCPYCIYTCTEPASLRDHISSHLTLSNPMSFHTIFGATLSPYEENTLKCPYCEFQCIETSNLRVHIMMHTAEAVLKLSNKKTTQKKNFRNKKQITNPKKQSKINKIHSNEYSFDWGQQIAKKSSFKNKSSNLLEVNETEDHSALWAKQISKQNPHNNNEHHGEYDFQWIQQIAPWAKSMSNYNLGKVEPDNNCPRCEMSFTNVKDLRKHFKSHKEKLGNKRSFRSILETRCDLCGATFSSRGHMKRHKESHGANRTFKCQHCDCSYSRKDNLLKHLSSAHSTDAVQAKVTSAT